jgi:hyperosmotically inducible protein
MKISSTMLSLAFATLLAIPVVHAQAPAQVPATAPQPVPMPQSADTLLSNKVLTSLNATKGPKATGVRITSANGIVELSGSATTLEEKENTERIARAVVGVRDVRNNVLVR